MACVILEEGAEQVLRVRAKAVLRKRARGVRAALPPSAVAARSAAIVATLASLPELEGARVVALFHAIPGRNEVDLAGLEPALVARGARVAYPCLPPRETVDLRAGVPLGFRCARGDELAERGWGFAEPPLDAPLADVLDVIVVPALALDPRGHRLGYGGGFYDRTLALHPHALTVGVAFDFQLIGEVPNTPDDRPVRVVVTEQRVLRP